MKFLLKQAKKMNLQYCNITLDVGAAMNAYLVEWMKQEEFKNIIIHLGDFHFIKENFKVLGLLIKNSGFLDIVFCSGICSSGRLKEWSNCSLSSSAIFAFFNLFSISLKNLISL